MSESPRETATGKSGGSRSSSTSSSTASSTRDANEQRIAELEARLAELEGGRRQAAPAGDRAPRDMTSDELEQELDRVEQGERELRSRRGALAQELSELAADPLADPHRIAEARTQTRQLTQRQEELRRRHAAFANELERRLRGTGGGRAGGARGFVRRSADPAGGSAGLGDPSGLPSYGIEPLTAGTAEIARLGHSLLLGHIGFLSAALGAAAATAEDVGTRAANRVANPLDFSAGFAPDVSAGLWSATDRTAAAPRRAAEAFISGYDARA